MLVARPVHGRSRHCCLRDGLQDLLKWLERGGPAPSGWSLGCKQHPLSQRGRSLSMMIQGLCFQPMVWAQNCWPGIATNSFPTPVHLSINFFTIYVGCLGTRPLSKISRKKCWLVTGPATGIWSRDHWVCFNNFEDSRLFEMRPSRSVTQIAQDCMTDFFQTPVLSQFQKLQMEVGGLLVRVLWVLLQALLQVFSSL